MVRTGLLFAALVALTTVANVRSQDADAAPPPDVDRDFRAEQADVSEQAPRSSASTERYYRQQRSRQSTHSASTARAEFRANERLRRLESRKWYGLSNARPTVTPTPWFGTYAPGWVSSGPDPSRWQDETDTDMPSVVVGQVGRARTRYLRY